MKNTVTFAMVSHSGCNIRNMTVSKQLVSAIGLLAAGCLILLLVFISKYEDVKSSISHMRTLQHTMVRQRHQIDIQNKQIQSFEEEINLLRETLAQLDVYEKQIRSIADTGGMDDQTNLFSIGGDDPEDSDPESMRLAQMADMQDQSDILKTAFEKQPVNFTDLLNPLEETAGLPAATPSVLPANGRITSAFGYRQSPFTKQREFHQGLDIIAPQGTVVIAAADGIIAFADSRGMLGKTIVIDHGHGTVTRYGHLAEIVKPVGSNVKRGEVIARIGLSSRSKESHLHYEVRINGIPVDPENYMDMVLVRR